MRYNIFLVLPIIILVIGSTTGFVVMEKTNTLEFCISCHSMKNTVFQEYKKTAHYHNRTGVHAECADCHVPKPLVPKLIAKLKASMDVYHELAGSIDTPEKFEAKRLVLAKRVWKTMKETDSRECRSCHTKNAMDLSLQKRRAQVQHREAELNNDTCIDCHKGITHKAIHKQQNEEKEESFIL
jgi:nitrate/TMAO reductase-like tetraheme cytochrome c subunit